MEPASTSTGGNRKATQDFVERAPFPIAMLDPSLCFIAHSPSWPTLCGLDAALGLSVSQAMPDIEQAQVDLVQRALSGQGETAAPASIVLPAGEGRWTQWDATPWRDEAGGVGGLLVLARDVTAQQAADREIERTRQFLDTIVENVPVLLAVKDSEQRFVVLNRFGAETLGRPREEIIDKTDYDIFPKALADGFRRRDQEILQSGELEVIEEEEVATASGMRILRCKKIAITDPSGSPCLLTVGEDVTDSLEAARALAEAHLEAEAANRAKSEFLANMSHEIRTPMNGIMGMNGLLLRSELSSDQRQYAEAVKTSADSLLGIINDILDISKLEAGKVELEHIDFSLEKIIEDAVELLSTKALEKGLDIGCYVDDGARRALRGDPTRLRQILLNLLSNSLKFTDRGFVSLEARSRPADDDRTAVRIEVHDTGIGLSPEAKAKLFQKFQQADGSITRRFGGTGLGLSICRQLVELMGGQIGVDDRHGGGATFWFEVTLAPADDPAAFEAPAWDRRRLVGARILVVDDIELNRDIFRRQLDANGAIIDEADGVEACLRAVGQAQASGKPYDLILLDHMMPGMAGDEAAEQIRARSDWPQPKLILASSMGSPLSSDRAAIAGFDAFLTKPVRLQVLLECVARVLGETIPADAGSVPAPEVPAFETAAGAPAFHGRVLLAEDHQINRLVAKTLLNEAGYHVVCVSNGAEAVEAVKGRRFDLILMDVQMPVLDGLQATRRIRALGGAAASIPIIAMTANAMQTHQDMCRDAGMDDYVSKPFDADLFLSTVASLMPQAGDDPGT